MTHRKILNRITVSIILLFIQVNTFAASFENLPIKIELPNGEVLQLYTSGNEFAHRVHDKDGYTVVKGDDGFVYYAIRNNSGDLVASVYRVGIINPKELNIPIGLSILEEKYREKQNLYNKDFKSVNLKNILTKNSDKTYRIKSNSKQTFNNIVIYISFPDALTMNKTKSAYDTIFNGVKTVSLNNYYHEVSYGALTMKSTFFPTKESESLTYVADNDRSYFQPYNATTNVLGYMNSDQHTGREQNLLANAINSLKQSIENLFTADDIDIDNDGYVDNITFIIQGSCDGWSDLLWAHRWSLYTQEVYIHNKRVMAYAFEPENQVVVSTLCHEMFHVLGAPDLYHYNDDDLTPVGKWDLMGSGTGHMGAYMKYAYGGWINEIPLITQPGIYTLNSLSSTTPNNICYRINSSNKDEYFVLEYRKKGGIYENSIYGSGIVAYRINEKIYSNGNRNGPPDEVYVYRPYGSLVENGNIEQSYFSADARRTMIGGTLLVTPFMSDGTDGLLRIKNISAAGESITFEVSSLPNVSADENIYDTTERVYSNKNKIIMLDVTKGSSISIWSTLGVCLINANSIISNKLEYTLPQCGVYIVRINNKSYKLMVNF